MLRIVPVEGSTLVAIAFAKVKGTKLGGSLEVPVSLAEVEGTEPGGSLEVPVALAEVEGAEPGGAPVVVVMSGGMCHGLSFGVGRCRRAAAIVFGVEVVRKCNS